VGYIRFTASQFNCEGNDTLITPNDSLQNKYSLVKGAARRARQLQSGAAPLVQSRSMKACRVAQEEILAGQVKYIVPQPKTLGPTYGA
jgi:DNA-directed RNA polymerase subunit omega